MIEKRIRSGAAIIAAVAALMVTPALAETPRSRILTPELRSRNLEHSKVGADPLRKMIVYLPAGYDGSSQRYPVIYFFANSLDGYRSVFDRNDAQSLFDSAIRAGVIDGFILVSVDMNTPLGNSWFVNSPATGNWEDLVIQEVVPYIDGNFRTAPDRDSRGLLGDRMGGYGAIRMGMRHPEVFGSVYALHPVGTGNGVQTMYVRPNWDLLTNAKSLADLKGDGFASIFTSIFQAHLPNPEKAPLFFDFPVRKTGNQIIIDSAITERLHNNFLLDRLIPQYAENLKSLRGFKFDWGRSDPNYDHVYSNQAFTHKLDEYGVPHEAEEYRGAWGDRNWGEEGRVYREVLPFFRRHLRFAVNQSAVSTR